MPRDYVQRKPAPKRKRGATKKKQPARAPAPKLLVLAAIVLLTGFGYLLFTISGSAKDAPEPQVQVKPKQKPIESKPLPAMPKEKYGYIRQLENQEVEVEVPEAPESSRPYLMQCGSFRTLQQADTQKARIAFQGLSSEVRRTEGKNGVWYRVVLGPYDSKRDAEKDRHILQRDSIQGCQIWYW